MWNILKRRMDAGVRRRLWQALSEEVKKNLEICYVMSQRGDLSILGSNIWQQARVQGLLGEDPLFLKYEQFIREYNRDFTAWEDYQRWYSSDLNRQTPENARNLHDKKERVEHRLQGQEGFLRSVVGRLGTEISRP